VEPGPARPVALSASSRLVVGMGTASRGRERSAIRADPQAGRRTPPVGRDVIRRAPRWRPRASWGRAGAGWVPSPIRSPVVAAMVESWRPVAARGRAPLERSAMRAAEANRSRPACVEAPGSAACLTDPPSS
jgi:hypothetical protein